MNEASTFKEHRIPRLGGHLYARDYAGDGSAFVLMHGFPDHLGAYDELVPFLVAAGRRVVTFDFLGFGRSDKSAGAAYDFHQQLGDLEAVAEALALGKFVPVAHDASGPTAINFCVDHPEQVASLCVMNSAYDDALPTVWPEMISLFADPNLRALSLAVAQSPAQFGWLLGWQKERFGEVLPPDQKAHFEAVTGSLIADNFIKQPGSGPAFIQLASDFFAELARNTKRLPQVAALELPVKVIWGALDPYITADVARNCASHFKHASLRLLDGGHWVQSDLPAEVAKEMLS
jgi:haloalkane dehalogenase